MRPLVMTWEYPPLKAGGIASHCQDLATTMVEKGHDPVVLTYGEQRETTVRDGVTVHRVVPNPDAPDTLSWSQDLSLEIQRLAHRLHDEEPFDLVHAHDWMPVTAASGFSSLEDVPMVFTMHSSQMGRDGVHSPYQRAIQSLEWRGCYAADRTIVVGQELAEEVRETYHPPEGTVTYIPNGIDLDRIDGMDTSGFDRSDYALDWERLVVFVGRLYPQKGVEYLIEAMPRVLEQHPDVKFVVAGKGQDEKYRRMAEERVGARAQFPGFLSEEELIGLLDAAYINVTPSVYEPFGIVPLEAAACRTPTVGSYVGGMKDTIVHERTGLHTYPGDPQSIVHQLDRALSDPGWTRELGEEARRYVEERFNWSEIADQTLELYRAVLDRSGP